MTAEIHVGILEPDIDDPPDYPTIKFVEHCSDRGPLRLSFTQFFDSRGDHGLYTIDIQFEFGGTEYAIYQEWNVRSWDKEPSRTNFTHWMQDPPQVDFLKAQHMKDHDSHQFAIPWIFV